VNKTLLSPQKRQRAVQEKILENSMFPLCSAQRLCALGGRNCFMVKLCT
jgi:hypothetical protein